MNEVFRKFSYHVSVLVGSAGAFAVAIAVVAAWAVTGPLFAFSDTWQLVINTGTTIVTFLMVFLIQNTQNRDNRALHAKLDELIISMSGADNRLAVAEDLSDDELKRLKTRFERLAATAEVARRGRRKRSSANAKAASRPEASSRRRPVRGARAR